MPRPVRPSLCTLCRLCALPSLASLYFNGPLVVPFPRFRVHLFSTFFAIKEGLSPPSPRHQDFLRLLCARVATSHADYDTEHMSFLIVLILGLASLSLFKGGFLFSRLFYLEKDSIRFDFRQGIIYNRMFLFTSYYTWKEVESLVELINR